MVGKQLRVAVVHPHLFDDEYQRERLRPLGEMARGKRIAVVGNAVSLMDGRHGGEIDRHDVVVRFNRGVIVAPDQQGYKTTIHCLACDVSGREVARSWPGARIAFVTPLRFHLADDLRDEAADCACLPIRDWWDLVNDIGGNRPSAGLSMLDYLRKFNCAKISIYGFDWKRTKTFYHDQKRPDWHSGEAERLLMLDWMRTMPDLFDASACPMD
jgi:hypothetical protein